jgi:hypothetical protein
MGITDEIPLEDTMPQVQNATSFLTRQGSAFAPPQLADDAMETAH